MSEEKITREILLKSLMDTLHVCRPDEYQMRHNILVRQLAAYVLAEEIEELEENDE